MSLSKKKGDVKYHRRTMHYRRRNLSEFLIPKIKDTFYDCRVVIKMHRAHICAFAVIKLIEIESGSRVLNLFAAIYDRKETR